MLMWCCGCSGHDGVCSGVGVAGSDGTVVVVVV